MRFFPSALLFLWALTSACVSAPSADTKLSAVDPSTAVTVETSGDLFNSPDGESYWVQYFGRCEKNEDKVIVEANSVKSEAPCLNFQYRYTHKIPKKAANSLNLFWITKLQFYHPGQKKNQALSWILFDTEKKGLKTVVNQQLRFERLPNGQLSPVVEFNALGTCHGGTEVFAKISGNDSYQQTVKKYEDKKPCQHGSFYFLSQIDGFSLDGFKFEVQELYSKKEEVVENPDLQTTESTNSGRQPASVESPQENPKPQFQWSIDLE